MAIDKADAFKIYYQEILPVNEIFNILKIDEKRELTFQTNSGSYIRYETFSNPKEFSEKIYKLNPVRIDVGAIYDCVPGKLNGAKIVGKELVFDIDLTDYSRECCDDKKVCEKCYEIIKCSIKLLDYILRNEFGFENLGFVFSGRRGVHCWVFGENDLNSLIRLDICKYFQNVIDRNISNKEYSKIISEFFTGKDLLQKYFIKIDKEVTVKMSHLIKMPFSVHPDTMNISIPLDPNNIKEFKDLPTVYDIIENREEINEYIEIMNKWI